MRQMQMRIDDTQLFFIDIPIDCDGAREEEKVLDKELVKNFCE
jgi:hypothetical protein